MQNTEVNFAKAFISRFTSVATQPDTDMRLLDF